MALSSNTVIHLTNRVQALIGILTNNFKIRYCKEMIYSKSTHVDLIIPMVSFCDIPFSQILRHIDSYGSYGIGLKKQWAEENDLNPVFYLDNNSMLSDNIIKHSRIHLQRDKKTIDELDEEDRLALDFIRFIKNYQGDLKRIGKKTIKDYRFSDEREWRYVLNPKLKYPLFGAVQTIEEEKIPLAKKLYNDKIENERLKFTPEDINYIIIKRENERDKIISTLEKVNSKYAHEQVKRLTSRIISTEQLRTDF